MSHVVSRLSFLAARKGWTLAVMVAMMGLSLATGPATAQTVAPGTDATTAAPAGAAAPANAAPPATAPGAPAAAPAADAPADTPAPDTKGLDQEVQGLKKDVVDLNRDLFVLEEELLFPANTQVAVFLSMDVGDFFALDSVQLKIDRRK